MPERALGAPADADADADAAVAPRRRSVQCASPAGLHRIAYREWGDPRNRDVLICVHGLTRSSQDFDALARELCGRFRVVCPDVAGRGDSERLADAKLYALPQYLADMVTLIARLDVDEVRWLGTSLGGLVGMALAAQAGTPVRRLILNDAGPVVARAALERIATYIGKLPSFATFEQAEAYVREIAAPFGPHSDAQWRTLTEGWVRRQPDGAWRPHYDPRIAEAFREAMPEKDIELWPLYDAVRCPTLVMRGALSDLLSSQTARAMAQRGPKAKVVEIPAVGHAPSLLHPDQISIVRDFLMEGDDK
jgi:pimeloyl-ACP methyl ester carboxylesterase